MVCRRRSIRSRLRGARTCGYGSRKKHRGKGSKGGRGMAGTGKRAGQMRTYVLKYFPEGYFGKRGFTSRKTRLNEINLADIQKNLNEFIKKGIAKKTNEGIEINLKDYKILSKGELKDKFLIKASAFSEKAKEKISKQGSKIVE